MNDLAVITLDFPANVAPISLGFNVNVNGLVPLAIGWGSNGMLRCFI